MAGGTEKHSRCPLCGGRLKAGNTAVPFVFDQMVIVVKDVPAEVCAACHEPYMTGTVTDRITDLLNRLRALQTEISVLSYTDLAEQPSVPS
jgi:YgiT-type zinc finger domain-containing protein